MRRVSERVAALSGGALPVSLLFIHHSVQIDGRMAEGNAGQSEADPHYTLRDLIWSGAR